jgi:hypothetical protein
MRSADPVRTLLFDFSNHFSALLLSPELPLLSGAAGREDKLEPKFARLLTGVRPLCLRLTSVPSRAFPAACGVFSREP